jgi:hypothetical protein
MGLLTPHILAGVAKRVTFAFVLWESEQNFREVQYLTGVHMLAFAMQYTRIFLLSDH